MFGKKQMALAKSSRGWQALGRLGAGFCLWAMIVLASLAQENPPPPPPPTDDLPREALPQNDVEVLTRGPVHEAFAEPLANDPEAGLIVPRKPPEDIAEVPPDFKPAGDDVVWISGYWAWDDDRDHFLWVSGIWRKLPPGLRWIPGYWVDADADGDWQWVSGLWVPDQQDELAYRVTPPESLEAGPNTPPPNDSYFWVPGCWMWSDVGYRWRPGYWHPYQENWVWVPAHWIWTPSGCLFVAGYWDYRIGTRGQLFAPVYFRSNNWYATHYYSPWCAIESTPLLVHFWVRPRYSHYYFGDYYGPNYVTLGLSPWSRWHSRAGRWDPLLTHYNVHYRHHDHFDYAARMSYWHSHYDSHIDERPRRTFQDQQQFAGQLGSKQAQIGQQSMLGVALATAATQSDRSVVLKPVTQDHKQLQFRESKQLRELTRERAKLEKFAKLDSDRGDQKDLGKGGRSADLTDKKTEGLKVDPPNTEKEKPVEPVKTLDSTVKLKSDEPGKKVADQGDKSGPDQRPTRRGSMKLPKATVTTGKLAADAPKTPAQIAVPPAIDFKDLPKVERSKIARPQTAQPIGGQNPSDSKTKPGEPKSTPRVESPKTQPKVELPKTQPKVELPKAQPKVELPKTQPKVELPKTQPKVELPKTQPKVEVPKAQPKVELPKSPKNEPPRRSDPPKRSDEDKKPKRGGK